MANKSRLIVELLAETKRFRAGMNQAGGELSKFDRRLKSVAGFARGAFAGVGVGLIVREMDRAAKAAISFGDEIDKAAKTAGIGAESLQELRYAAELTGQTHKQLDDAVARFNRRLGEGRRGNKAYADTFAELGVTATDTADQALDKAFRALAQIQDQSVRTATATKIFGDDARRMALLVEGGADSLDKMRQAARDGGRVLSEEMTRNAAEANDKLTALDATLKTKLNNTVLESIDGFIGFKTLLHDVQVAAVETAAAIGAAYDRMLDKTRALGERSRETLLVQLRLATDELAAAEARLAREQAGEGRFRGPTEKTINDVTRLRAEVERLTIALDPGFSRFAGGLRSTAEILKDAGLSAQTELPGAAAPRAVKAPGAPSLKSDAIMRESEKAGEAIARIAEAARTPLQKLKDELAEIERLKPFAETAEELESLLVAGEQVQAQIDELGRKTTEWSRLSQDAAAGIADAFAGAIAYSEDLLGNLKRLAQALAHRAIFDFLSRSISSAVGIPIPGRAAGGPVSAGRPYIVGEKGPELFVPANYGRVMPDVPAGGAGMQISVVNRFDVGLESVEERIESLTPRIVAGVVGAVEAARRRPSHA